MNTPFDGDRQWRRSREPALSELPAWGLEIMMGLYGPETIGKACGHEAQRQASARGRRAGRYAGGASARTGSAPTTTRPDDAAPTMLDPICSAQPISPMVLQLEAVNELVRYVERKFKRH